MLTASLFAVKLRCTIELFLDVEELWPRKQILNPLPRLYRRLSICGRVPLEWLSAVVTSQWVLDFVWVSIHSTEVVGLSYLQPLRACRSSERDLEGFYAQERNA
jgi:hypothetical protein